MKPHRISRVVAPDDLNEWVQRLGGSELLAGEYNKLIDYLNERESCLASSEDPNVSRHAGFVLSIVTNVMNEAVRSVLSHTQVNSIDELTEPLIRASGARRLREDLPM
jgi:hypothetical protein